MWCRFFLTLANFLALLELQIFSDSPVPWTGDKRQLWNEVKIHIQGYLPYEPGTVSTSTLCLMQFKKVIQKSTLSIAESQNCTVSGRQGCGWGIGYGCWLGRVNRINAAVWSWKCSRNRLGSASAGVQTLISGWFLKLIAVCISIFDFAWTQGHFLLTI